MEVNDQIKLEILSLPIIADTKVELYLFLRGLKRGCELVVIPPKWMRLEKYLNTTWPKMKKCINFCEKYHLLYKTLYQCGTVMIANNDKDLKILYDHQMQYPSHGGKSETVLNMGRISGYPMKAVKEFAKNIKMIDAGGWPKTLRNNKTKVPSEVDGKYWEKYIQYIVRSGHEMEDSLVAKKWADTIMKEFPELHKEFLKFTYY